MLTSGAGYDLPDVMRDAGPVSGLVALCDHVAVQEVPKTWMILPIDMPLLTADALRRLLQSDARAAHFTDHPFHLLLHFDEHTQRTLSDVRPKTAASHGVSVMRLAHMLGAAHLDSPDQTCLTNINTPADWQRMSVAS